MNSANTLPAIQMFWAGGQLTTMERLCIASFLANGHPVHLYSYEPIGNAPAGTTLRDARDVLPESELFAHSHPAGFGSYAPFANRFRFKLLAESGGVWSDTDVVCIKPMTFLKDMPYAFAGQRMAKGPNGEQPIHAVPCFIQVPAGSALMADCYAQGRSVDLRTAAWATSGTRVFHEQMIRHQLTSYLLQPNVCCPIDFWDFPNIFTNIYVVSEETYAIHLWNEMWRRSFFDKDASYDPLSLYERLKRHYLKSPAL